MVDAKVAFAAVLPVANGARVLALEVCRPVLLQSLHARKLAATVLALVSAIVRVNVQVRDQIRTMDERFLTVRALLGANVQMHPAMFGKIVQILATYRAETTALPLGLWFYAAISGIFGLALTFQYLVDVAIVCRRSVRIVVHQGRRFCFPTFFFLLINIVRVHVSFDGFYFKAD